MSERRENRRSKSFLRGFVYVSRKRGALACLVRDLSDTGARIIFSDTVTLPHMVDLYIPQRDLTLRARVEWRKNDEIGLAFPPSEKVPDAPLTAEQVAHRLAMLEAEIGTLRALLKKMRGEKHADEVAA